MHFACGQYVISLILAFGSPGTDVCQRFPLLMLSTTCWFELKPRLSAPLRYVPGASTGGRSRSSAWIWMRLLLIEHRLRAGPSGGARQQCGEHHGALHCFEASANPERNTPLVSKPA